MWNGSEVVRLVNARQPATRQQSTKRRSEPRPARQPSRERQPETTCTQKSACKPSAKTRRIESRNASPTPPPYQRRGNRPTRRYAGHTTTYNHVPELLYKPLINDDIPANDTPSTTPAEPQFYHILTPCDNNHPTCPKTCTLNTLTTNQRLRKGGGDISF